MSKGQKLQESLSTELKEWFNPNSPDGKAKLVKAIIALRNFNGGVIYIGVENRGQPVKKPENLDIDVDFHIDMVQSIVGAFCSEVFEVRVEAEDYFGERIVKITIPPGVKVPVVSKSPIKNDGGHPIVKSDAVYFRTLKSNNTPSSSELNWKMYPDLMDICFDNREADIARFINRNLSSDTLEGLQSFFLDTKKETLKSKSAQQKAEELLNHGWDKFAQKISKVRMKGIDFATYEVSAILDAPTNATLPDREFLNKINHTNPNFSGWPPWVVLDRTIDNPDRPIVSDHGWQAFIYQDVGHTFDHIDFWIAKPSAEFYLARIIDDDIGSWQNKPKSGTTFEFALMIRRVSEVITVLLRFGNALAIEKDNVKFTMIFRWKNMESRFLSTWSNPMRYLSLPSRREEKETIVKKEIPINASNELVIQIVYEIANSVLVSFDGFSIQKSIVEDIFQKMLNRQ